MDTPPAIEILDPGLLSTVQDQGRSGVGELGVSPTGFADWLSARAANRLVGNRQSEALIETNMTGISFKTLRDLRIAVTGAVAHLTIRGGAKPLWQSVYVRSGGEVKLSAAERGLRSYVAIYGGIDVPVVLGSASTDVTAGFGGLQGRALARGDTLALKPIEGEVPEEDRALAPAVRPYWRRPAVLRVLPGPHANRLTQPELSLLQNQTYRVSPRSNRQGVRLDGKPLATLGGFDVLSIGVSAGCIQLSSDGLPIILLSEHQATGGYAVPLCVISGDVPDAAQLKPGDEVSFRLVNQAEAAVALAEKMQALTEALNEPSAAG